MLYENPTMEIIEFEIRDVICASVGGTYEGDDGNNSSGSGSWVNPNTY